MGGDGDTWKNIVVIRKTDDDALEILVEDGMGEDLRKFEKLSLDMKYPA